MQPSKTLDYGTVAPAAEQKSTSKKGVAAVAAVLVCAAVFAVSFSSGFSKVNSAVNSNSDRAGFAGTSDDLPALFNDVCESKAMRYIIATFDESGETVIPCVSRAGSDHWEADFENFKDDIARCAAESPIPAAFAIYNQPVWKDASHNVVEIYPSNVHYLEDKADLRLEMTAGTFLGGVKLASKCAPYTIEVSMRDTYKTACAQLGVYAVDEQMCNQIEDQQCPFDGEVNPCNTGACSVVDGGSFFTEGEGLGAECCDAIMDHCTDNTGAGCGNYAMNHIFKQHCDASYVAAEPSVEEYLPKWVEAREAAEATAEAAAAEAAEAAAADVAPAVDAVVA